MRTALLAPYKAARPQGNNQRNPPRGNRRVAGISRGHPPEPFTAAPSAVGQKPHVLGNPVFIPRIFQENRIQAWDFPHAWTNNGPEMRPILESLQRYAVPAATLALVCAASPLAAQTARSQPQVVKEGESVGFRVRPQPLALAPISLDVSKFAFTAPGRVEPGRSQEGERGFTFTPSRAAKGGVSVGMAMRSVAPVATDQPAADNSAATPGGYNFDLTVGYKGFAVSGGTSHVDTGIGGRNREAVDLGIGYGARNWHAGLQASSEREAVNLMPRAKGDSQRYTVEARGAVDLSSKISVGGTLRYRPATQNPTLLDPQRDDRAVIVGGAVVF